MMTVDDDAAFNDWLPRTSAHLAERAHLGLRVLLYHRLPAFA
jgi:hypothetical protein